ncbi:DUF1360 domain-containing protein [Saccharothrix sp. AJ9571]|nr:DUF1360 domain-containing protein [Saccharothrix sp. AJ9571]
MKSDSGLKRLRERYENGERRPLPGYLLSLGAYGVFTGALALVGKRTGARLPKRIGLGDTVLLAVATHKASRLLTKEAVTSPLRAPFTRYEAPAGEAELVESVPEGGHKHAVGELLTCPFCAAVWIATGLSAGLVLAPRQTRLVSTVLAAVAGSDLLQLGYDRAKHLTG